MLSNICEVPTSEAIDQAKTPHECAQILITIIFHDGLTSGDANRVRCIKSWFGCYWHYALVEIIVCSRFIIEAYLRDTEAIALHDCTIATNKAKARLIPGLHPANLRSRYKLTPTLIGWAQIYSQPCKYIIAHAIWLNKLVTNNSKIHKWTIMATTPGMCCVFHWWYPVLSITYAFCSRYAVLSYRYEA